MISQRISFMIFATWQPNCPAPITFLGHEAGEAVICGDRPVLELQADGTVMVHPSPWNGKENWHGAEKAPLAGILCLKRGKETSIRRWTKAEAVIPVYMSLISSRETEELIRQLSAFETELLTRVPVYEYVNGGVPDSARYLYENLLDGGRLEGET